MTAILTNMCMLQDADGRVLVQHRLPKAGNPWAGLTFPGGHVEPGESIAGSMAFYDLSCSSYYGTHCERTMCGYNRDGLKLPAIEYGLLTDREGEGVRTSLRQLRHAVLLPVQVRAQRVGGESRWRINRDQPNTGPKWAAMRAGPKRSSRTA